MSLKEQLFADLKTAMKEKDTIKKDTIQLIRSGVLQIEKDNKVELDDEGVIEVISKQLKSRRDSLPDYEKSGNGKVIRLAFPELTEERRKDLVKDIRKIAEESKVAIRAIRRDGMDMAKTAQKNNEMTQDDLTAAETKIQKMTDTKIAEIDELLAKKEKEIMTV